MCAVDGEPDGGAHLDRVHPPEVGLTVDPLHEPGDRGPSAVGKIVALLGFSLKAAK